MWDASASQKNYEEIWWRFSEWIPLTIVPDAAEWGVRDRTRRKKNTRCSIARHGWNAKKWEKISLRSRTPSSPADSGEQLVVAFSSARSTESLLELRRFDSLLSVLDRIGNTKHVRFLRKDLAREDFSRDFDNVPFCANKSLTFPSCQFLNNFF